MFKVLVILFIVKLYARNNISNKEITKSCDEFEQVNSG